MTAAKEAKTHGIKSLKALTESTGYNIDTLRRMHRDKPLRFKLLCLGHVCHELSIGGVELREYAKLKQTIKVIK
jgi:hypothetical protein